MGRPPNVKTCEPEITPETPKLKHKIVCISQYYIKAREMGLSENIRDVSLALLFDEHGANIVAQVNDIKSGDIKFVVKA